MNIFTHILIGSSIRGHIYRQTGVRLSFFGFIYGNILPDLSGESKKHPHYFVKSIDFVVDSAMGLCADESTCDCTGSFEYSKRAGAVMHYISDFFCYAHTGSYKKDIYHHHLYELLLCFAFGKGQRAFRQTDTDSLFHVAPANLSHYVKSATERYDGEGHCKYKDIHYALRACAAATEGLLLSSSYAGGNKPALQEPYALGNLLY
jgi:hypothetical protein